MGTARGKQSYVISVAKAAPANILQIKQRCHRAVKHDCRATGNTMVSREVATEEVVVALCCGHGTCASRSNMVKHCPASTPIRRSSSSSAQRSRQVIHCDKPAYDYHCKNLSVRWTTFARPPAKRGTPTWAMISRQFTVSRKSKPWLGPSTGTVHRCRCHGIIACR